MKAHLDAVGWIDLVAGAPFTALGALVGLGVLVLAPAFYGGPLWSPADAAFVHPVVGLISAALLAIGIPNLIAGAALLRKQRSGRVLAMVLAVLALATVPLGTATGLYTLWVLTHRDTEPLLSLAA